MSQIKISKYRCKLGQKQDITMSAYLVYVREQTLMLCTYGLPCSTSGEQYSSVPQNAWKRVPGSSRVAEPKSISLI